MASAARRKSGAKTIFVRTLAVVLAVMLVGTGVLVYVIAAFAG